MVRYDEQERTELDDDTPCRTTGHMQTPVTDSVGTQGYRGMCRLHVAKLSTPVHTDSRCQHPYTWQTERQHLCTSPCPHMCTSTGLRQHPCTRLTVGCPLAKTHHGWNVTTTFRSRPSQGTANTTAPPPHFIEHDRTAELDRNKRTRRNKSSNTVARPRKGPNDNASSKGKARTNASSTAHGSSE